MDRNREARRATIAVTNGLSRRRHRSNSLRDSPEEDGPVELPETARLRDRGILKKDRDRDRERERDRERDRDRDRDRLSRSKRRRGDRLMHGSNREEGEESSEESVNDEEEDYDDDGGGSIRILPPNPSSLSTSSMLNHRKSFPPPAKVFRAAPTWKAADEMIGVSVPRKARSASTKRSHECWTSNGGAGGDPIHRQASTSPVRPSIVTIAEASPARPISPSSSNASARKKMKPSGPKQRPPKSSSKSSSSAQDEIEIEIAEVLYGMMRQPLCPKQEIAAIDSREANKSSSSRVSSPISNSQSVVPQSTTLPQNSSSAATPVSATAPKRKRPRPVKYEDENPSIFTVRNNPISSITKVEIEQSTKIETSSPNLERNQGSAAENGGIQYDLTSSNAGPPSSDAPPELEKLETDILSASKPLGEGSENKDVGVTKEEPQSPKTESPVLRLNDVPEDVKSTKSNSGIEIQEEEKFQIDLMASPPPTLRSSPEREGDTEFAGVDPKPMVQDVQIDLKPLVKENDNKAVKIGKGAEEKKAKGTIEEVESQKPILNKERLIDLQFDLEKSERDSSNKLNQQHVQKQQQPSAEKAVQANSLPLPMSVAGWPSGLPPMGYMAPLQGVVSMDGSTVPSAAIQPPHLLSTQPRPKRCATHCYIARNICYHQQLSRMNPFWPAGAGAASLYGDKPCNLNVVPSAELHGNIAGRSVSTLQDKGPGLAMFPGHTGKDKGAQVANMVDAGQRKQIMLQQALPPGAPSNILHGPAFIFPLSQQQPVAAASVRPGSVKSPPVVGSAAPSSASNSSSASASATAAAAAATMSLYPNMPSNETQYLAILQNNAYPFPIPAHVGAAPAYRGAQGMPFFNGSFYSSQILHPSQLQQQQQQQQPPTQPQQPQQAHQNSSISGGSSSSQKHLQNQQQRQQPSGINGSTGSLQGFPASKNQPSHSLQRQQQQNQHFLPSHQTRQLDNEMGGEDSPSTADSRVSRTNMSVYNQNFAMPIHPPNFALMSPASMGGAGGSASASGNNSEKKQQQQQQGLKAGVETLPSQPFAMSFASINGATTSPGFDMSSIAQNHAILQGLPEATRHSYQFMAAAAAAQAAQQKKNFRVSEDGKTGGGDSSTAEEQRKVTAGKASATMGHSIAFSRPDFPDKSVSSLPGNTVIDSSARAINMSSTSGRSSGSVVASAIGTVNASSSQRLQQHHQQQQQQQQMLQLQKQHQYAAAAAAAARNKTPPPSNGSVYCDNLPSSSMAAKFPNALSAFPQNLVQCSSSSPAQSPQWKNSVRTTTSQASSQTLASSTSSLKNLAQQQARTQPSHTQISFAANSKSSAAAQGQQSPSSNQSPSSPMVVGSPTSSMSKGAGGSPRTTASTSTGTKPAPQASSLSSQHTKNSAAMPGRKSSPVGGRTVPSILGNPHTTSSSTTKPQLPQQQHQHQHQQLPKQALQQSQFFSNAFMQVPHSTSATSTATANSGYYLQRRRTEQQQQQQQSQGSSGTSSTGVLSLCPPVTHANASTTDPTKAAAAAAAVSSMKVGGLPSQFAAQFAATQSSGNPYHIVPAGFPYVHAVPTAVQVKPVEQKQPAGE